FSVVGRLPPPPETRRPLAQEAVAPDASAPVVPTPAVTGIGAPVTTPTASSGSGGAAGESAPRETQQRTAGNYGGGSVRVAAEKVERMGSVDPAQAAEAQSAALDAVESCLKGVSLGASAKGLVILTVFAPDVPSSAPTGESDFDLTPRAQPMN